MTEAAHPDRDPVEETEAQFLARYNPRDYPSVSVTCDVVLLTIRHGRLSVLLIRRANHPYRGHWALPGGFIEPEETLDVAALRELEEETGVQVDLASIHIEQLMTYGDPGRDPRNRTVTVAYLALVPNAPTPEAGSDAAEARFFAVDDLRLASPSPNPGSGIDIEARGPTPEERDESEGVPLAFDHDRIIADAVERTRAKLEYTTVAPAFIDEPFTLGELRRVYETVWDTQIHAANFRRKVLSTSGFVESTGATTATDGRPAQLFVRGRATYLHPPFLRHAPDA